jgi:SHS2 domain-containing protein
VLSYQYLEDVAISDLAVEARGDTPKEMFEAAARALTEAMVDIKQVRPRMEKTIRLTHEAMDQVLFDWLAELIYLKDAEGLLFSQFQVDLSAVPAQAGLTAQTAWRLVGKVRGESIDPNRHSLHLDVKAVTYHLFEVAQKDGQWVARVVLDI